MAFLSAIGAARQALVLRALGCRIPGILPAAARDGNPTPATAPPPVPTEVEGKKQSATPSDISHLQGDIELNRAAIPDSIATLLEHKVRVPPQLLIDALEWDTVISGNNLDARFAARATSQRDQLAKYSDQGYELDSETTERILKEYQIWCSMIVPHAVGVADAKSNGLLTKAMATYEDRAQATMVPLSDRIQQVVRLVEAGRLDTAQMLADRVDGEAARMTRNLDVIRIDIENHLAERDQLTRSLGLIATGVAAVKLLASDAGANGLSKFALLSASQITATVVSHNLTSGVMLWGAVKQYCGGQEYREFLQQHYRGEVIKARMIRSMQCTLDTALFSCHYLEPAGAAEAVLCATLSPTPSTPPLTARPTLTSAAGAAGADGAAPSSAASTVPPPASEPVEAIQIRIPGSRAALEASFVESFGGGGEPAGLAELAGASIVPPMPGCGEGVAFTADANVESDACDTFCETTVWVGTPPPPGYVAPPATPTVAAMIAEAVVASAADVPAAAAARTRPPALVQKLKQQMRDAEVELSFVVVNELSQLRLQAEAKIETLGQALAAAQDPPPPVYDLAL